MSACIIKAHRAGLFSLINNVITCSAIYDDFQVDWQVKDGCLYGSEEDGNIFDHLFRKRPNVTEEDDDPSVLIRDYPHQLLTYKNAGSLYQSDRLTNWRDSCCGLWYSLFVNRDIENAAIEFSRDSFDSYISVLIRANSHAGEQLDNRNQSLDEYADAIEEHEDRLDKVFVAGDQESIAWLGERFPVVYYPDPFRPESRDSDRHLQKQQTIEDAKRCIEEVIIMSHARTFIHPISNMATAALYINPELESVYLR